MEILHVVSVLWRRRLTLGLGLLAAVALGVFTAHAKSMSSGVAFTRVALDTPKSQLVSSAPIGAGTLPWRASLMTHLVASVLVKERIARRLGIRIDHLAVVDPTLTAPAVPAALPKSAAEVAAIDPAPYVLTVYQSNGALPIISIAANAPDKREAVRLAAAGAAVLEADASSARGPVLQKFVVESVAPIHARTLVTSTAPIKSVAMAVVVFGIWCAAIAVWIRLRPDMPRSRSRIGPT